MVSVCWLIRLMYILVHVCLFTVVEYWDITTHICCDLYFPIFHTEHCEDIQLSVIKRSQSYIQICYMFTLGVYYAFFIYETAYWFTVWRFQEQCQFKCNSNSFPRKWTFRSTRIRVNISLQFHFNELYNPFISQKKIIF